MEKIVDLHHDIMFFLIVIVAFVAYIIVHVCDTYGLFEKGLWYNDKTNSRLAEHLRVEFSHYPLLEKI